MQPGPEEPGFAVKFIGLIHLFHTYSTMRLLVLCLIAVFATGSFLPHGLLPNLPLVNAIPDVCPQNCVYTTIQEAVDASVVGSKIIVGPGTYNESVLIMKPLTLIALDRNTTIVQTTKPLPTVNITATTNVVLANFTVQTATFGMNAIQIQDSTDVNIANNTITRSVYGIFIQGGSNNTIITNLIDRNGVAGIGIIDSANNTLRNNLITNVITTTSQADGIDITSGSGNLIANNSFTGNILGIEISGSTKNVLARNLVADGEAGIDMIDRSTANNVTGNQVVRNTFTGISIRDSNGNTIFENLIADNHDPQSTGGLTGIGIHIQNSSGNKIFRNSLVDNDRQMFAVCSGTFLGIGSCGLADDMLSNMWDDGLQGNFWNDYTGVDDGSGGRIAGDGVGDTRIPHPCPNGQQPCSINGPAGVDSKPLMSPFPPPILLALPRAAPTSGFPPLQVRFNGTAYGGKLQYTYSWNFGDSSLLSPEQNATHTYTLVGSFEATLTVTDSDGKRASRTVIITVLRPEGDLIIVVLGHDGAPLLGAQIVSTITPQGQSPAATTTDSTGRAFLGGLLEGFYVIRVVKSGYDSATLNITITRGVTENRTLTLTPIPNWLGQVAPYLAAGLAVAITGASALVLFLRRRRRHLKPQIGRQPSPKRASRSFADYVLSKTSQMFSKSFKICSSNSSL